MRLTGWPEFCTQKLWFKDQSAKFSRTKLINLGQNNNSRNLYISSQFLVGQELLITVSKASVAQATSQKAVVQCEALSVKS